MQYLEMPELQKLQLDAAMQAKIEDYNIVKEYKEGEITLSENGRGKKTFYSVDRLVVLP